MIEKDLLKVINDIRVINGNSIISDINNNISLRKDLNFDSMDLATLTVKLEDIYGVDVFEDGLVDTIGEILEKIK